ncbi:MAG: RHS repeat-associated core domain-containing protein, partial [Coriobacteriia bacterium]
FYLPARCYDPATYRFLSQDPAAPSAGDPLSLNAYAYCLGDPVNRSDPSGAVSDMEADAWRYYYNKFEGWRSPEARAAAEAATHSLRTGRNAARNAAAAGKSRAAQQAAATAARQAAQAGLQAALGAWVAQLQGESTMAWVPRAVPWACVQYYLDTTAMSSPSPQQVC